MNENEGSFPGNLADAVVAIMGLVLVLGMPTAVQADPLSTYDEGLNAILILQECKVDFSEVSHPCSSPEPKTRAMGDAAWHQLWDTLDKQDPAHHDENARKADLELKSGRRRTWPMCET